MGDHPHRLGEIGRDKETSSKVAEYPEEPKMREELPQEHGTWANITSRYTKNGRTRARNARTPNPERKCRTCGEAFRSKTVMNVHQTLPSKCADNADQYGQASNSRPNNICNYKRSDHSEMQVRIFYSCRGKHTSRTQ